MTKHLFIIVIFTCQFAKAQQINTLENHINYIEVYYSEFQTGYDFDGEHIILTNNYKATFSGSIFTLTFDVLDNDKNIENKVITFNFKEVESIEPYGGDIVEINDSEGFSIPVSYNVLFKTKSEAFSLKVYVSQEDVTTTEIYQAFEEVIKFYKN